MGPYPWSQNRGMHPGATLTPRNVPTGPSVAILRRQQPSYLGVDLGINLSARCLSAVSPVLGSVALLLPVSYFSSGFVKEYLLLSYY